MEPTKSSTQVMDQLPGWVTKEELLRCTGITKAQLLLWHRKVFAFSTKPLFRRPGRGRGSVTLYHPDAVSIVRRILEMKEMWPRDFEVWHWHLWLEGYPISVREDCIRIIHEAQEELQPQPGQDALDVLDIIMERIGKPRRGSLTARIYNRIGDGSNLYSLLPWMVSALLGEQPIFDWNDLVDAEEPLDLIWIPEKHENPTIGELARDAMGVPDEWAQSGPPRELMSIDAAQHALDGATDAEWEQAREDWRTVEGVIVTWGGVHSLYKHFKKAMKGGSVDGDTAREQLQALHTMTKALPMGMVTRPHRDTLCRAMLVGFLMQIRRSSLNGNVDSVMATLREFTLTVSTAMNGHVVRTQG